RDRRVRPALDEVADPVAAVAQPAALAVDLRERRLTGDDALEAGRVGTVIGGRSSGRRRGGTLGHGSMVAPPRQGRRGPSRTRRPTGPGAAARSPPAPARSRPSPPPRRRPPPVAAPPRRTGSPPRRALLDRASRRSPPAARGRRSRRARGRRWG